MTPTAPWLYPILLLLASNVFMTVAWRGHGAHSAAEPKTMQGVIALAVLAAFSVPCFGEASAWSHTVGFDLIAAGAFFAIRGQIG